MSVVLVGVPEHVLSNAREAAMRIDSLPGNQFEGCRGEAADHLMREYIAPSLHEFEHLRESGVVTVTQHNVLVGLIAQSVRRWFERYADHLRSKWPSARAQRAHRPRATSREGRP